MISENRRKKLFAVFMACASGAILMCSPAYAETSSAAGEAAAPADQLGEVIVTAQRRGENLQKVPITVDVVSATDVTNYGIQTSQQLQTAVAGLIINQAQMNTAPFLRGVGANSGAAGLEMPVAIYVDGIYTPIASGNVFNLTDIDRVEVLKGPQGTLFGRNATGGVISIVTRDPGQQARADFDVSYGNYNTWAANAYVGGPLSNSVAADIVYSGSRQEDGFGRNITTGGQAAQAIYSDVVRSKVLWSIDDATQLSITGEYTDQKSSMDAFVPVLGASDFLNAVPSPMSHGFYDDYGNPSFYVDRGYAVSGKLRHDFGWGTVTDMAAYQDHRIQQDLSFTSVPEPTPDNISFNHETVLTNELQIASLSNQTVTWIAGLFYMDLRNAGTYGTAFDYPGSIYTLEYNTPTTQSIAPFGQVTWNVTQSTRLTGGLRYTRDDLHISGVGYDAVVAGHALVPTSTLDYPSFAHSNSQSKVTFRAAVEQDVSSDVMTYASFNRGFRAGLYDTENPQSPATKPETLDAYEVGVKSALFDHRVTLNASIFHYEYSNILLRAFDTTNLVDYLTNAAHGLETGGDLDLRARLEGFDVTGGLEVISAYYNNFPNAILSTRLPNGQNTYTTGSASGNQMIQVPKVSLQAGVSRSVFVGENKITASVNLKHTGPTYFDPDNRFKQGSVDLLSSALKWTLPGNRWDISLFGTNLLNKQYFQGYSNGGSDYIVVAPPRQYGVKFAAHF
jgi:iron complex outermembrane recepter protein